MNPFEPPLAPIQDRPKARPSARRMGAALLCSGLGVVLLADLIWFAVGEAAAIVDARWSGLRFQPIGPGPRIVQSINLISGTMLVAAGRSIWVARRWLPVAFFALAILTPYLVLWFDVQLSAR